MGAHPDGRATRRLSIPAGQNDPVANSIVAEYVISILADQNVTVADMEDSIIGANTTAFLDLIEIALSGNPAFTAYTFSVVSITAGPMSPSPSPMGPSPVGPSPSPSPS